MDGCHGKDLVLETWRFADGQEEGNGVVHAWVAINNKSALWRLGWRGRHQVALLLMEKVLLVVVEEEKAAATAQGRADGGADGSSQG